MKKIAVLLMLIFAFSSCNYFNNNEDANKGEKKDIIIGGDKDKNGCLSSAGYTWSKLNKECVRAFSGIPLYPINQPEGDATFCAYILFNGSGDKAEIFLPNKDESIILERSVKNKPWIFKQWELIPLNGYQLKESGKLVFSGDGEIGGTIIDDNEEIPEGE
jgi:hypothetical protein